MSNFQFDAESRHQHYLERFKTGEVNSLLPFLKRVEESLILQLSKAKTYRSQVRIKKILATIQSDTTLILEEYTDQLSLDLVDVGTAEADFTVGTLAQSQDLDFVTPSVTQITAAANARPFNSMLLKDELKDFSKQQAKFIRNNVALGFAEGQTNQQIIQSVVGSSELNFKDGSMQVTRNAARRMVRTSIQHTAAVAKSQVYADNDDLIDKYAWVSTLDSRTSPTCKARDGRVYEIDKGPLPPAHPNCRSTTIAVFDDDIKKVDGEEKLNLTGGTRPMRNEDGGATVNVKNDYNSWLKRQSAGFQVDALGKSRAELFRKGGLSVDKFVDRQDKPLTLAELRKTFPKAWEKAGI